VRLHYELFYASAAVYRDYHNAADRVTGRVFDSVIVRTPRPLGYYLLLCVADETVPLR